MGVVVDIVTGEYVGLAVRLREGDVVGALVGGLVSHNVVTHW